MPSKLRQQAMQLAEKLIRNPGSQGPSRQGVEREAGYILLGALCASNMPKTQKVPKHCLKGSVLLDTLLIA